MPPIQMEWFDSNIPFLINKLPEYKTDNNDRIKVV